LWQIEFKGKKGLFPEKNLKRYPPDVIRELIATHPNTKYVPCKMIIKNIPAELTEKDVYFFLFFF
jgi:hypothetical protein